jgi:hypothetical protein
MVKYSSCDGIELGWEGWAREDPLTPIPSPPKLGRGEQKAGRGFDRCKANTSRLRCDARRNAVPRFASASGMVGCGEMTGIHEKKTVKALGIFMGEFGRTR